MYGPFREKLHVNHLRGERVKESAGLTRGWRRGFRHSDPPSESFTVPTVYKRIIW